MKVIAIAAVSQNGMIGRGSELPWTIPEDMKFFRDSTRDHIVIMGRKTFDALGKALPKRENAVITRDANWSRDNTRVFSKLEEAISFYQKHEPADSNRIIFIIGGAEIYKLSISMLDEVWLTEIDTMIEPVKADDVFFPYFSNGIFHRAEFERSILAKQLDFESSKYRYSFVRYARQ